MYGMYKSGESSVSWRVTWMVATRMILMQVVGSHRSKSTRDKAALSRRPNFDRPRLLPPPPPSGLPHDSIDTLLNTPHANTIGLIEVVKLENSSSWQNKVWFQEIWCRLYKLYFAMAETTRTYKQQRKQENHAIAKMTARCAQYVSALKIVGPCMRKISRRLCKNLHITILSLFGGAMKLFSKYSIQCAHGT